MTALRIILLLLATCSPLAASPPLADAAPPIPAQIMIVPPGLQQDFARYAAGATTPRQKVDRLVDFLFKPDGLGISYQGDATYTVEQVYRTRRANCLSFSLLAVALGRHAGLTTYGQEVAEALAWSKVETTVFRARHINAGVRVGEKRLTIDVGANEVLATEPPAEISDERLLAHYYNNRAIDLMNVGRLDEAHQHAAISLGLDAGFATSWSNLGVLHERSGQPVLARQAFESALRLDAEHTSALANLVANLQRDGRPDAAAPLIDRLEQIRARDPLHQYMQALEYERRGDFVRARAGFRRAIRLYEPEHAFHFGLARVQHLLGNDRGARHALARAHALSTGETRSRYEAKLNGLSRPQTAWSRPYDPPAVPRCDRRSVTELTSLVALGCAEQSGEMR